MSEVYLKFYQEVEKDGTGLWNDYIVIISFSSSIEPEEAKLKAQKELVNSDFIITKYMENQLW